ncbi:hypothetical protein ACJJTC_012820 [Scirpophaga incertulas]
MENFQVCRICLITGVKMYNMFSYPYEQYFTTSTGINLLNGGKLPGYACYQCAALIKKWYLFREKCLKTQSILFNILATTGEITYENVAQVDRVKLNLASSIIISHNENTNYSNVLIQDEDLKDFKPEYTETTADVCDNYDEGFNNYVEKEDTIEEDGYSGVPKLPYPSSDDDKPLSIHKSNKDKEKKKSGKKKGHKKKEVKEELIEAIEKVESIEVTEDISELLPLLDEVPQKRKRGRPRKAATSIAMEEKEKRPRRTQNTGGVDIEDIDLDEYVNVVKLSLKEQIEEVTMRQNTSNYMNAPFQCNLCFRGFIDTDAWNHHIGKHSESAGDIECPVCKFRFKTKRALQKHSANHEKKYACKSCSYVSKTTTQAKQHQRWHKGVTYKCQHCDEVLVKWTSYLSHVRIKHPSEFICDVCGYSFVSKLGLAMHRTMMHKEVVEKEAAGDVAKGGPYCAECAVTFISEEAYKRHMVTSAKHIHNSNFQNGCRACGGVFASAEELRVHHRREHARKRPKNYGKRHQPAAFPVACQYCSVQMENARQYWAHFRRVHPDKNYPIRKDYVCDVCGKSFRGNAFLVYHKRTHQEERMFSCSVCGKARPYPCAVCGKAFKCKGALDRHFRSHTGVKPYVCEVCGKAFGQSNSRKLHVRTVHLRQPAPYVSRARQERRARPPLPPPAAAPAPAPAPPAPAPALPPLGPPPFA